MAKSPGNIRVLLVDDAEYAREATREHLNKMGFTSIFEAGDGAEAFERLMSLSVDLIITDWKMPRMDGLEFLKKIKGEARFKGIPVIILTVHGDAGKVVEAVKSGVNDYIVKPVTLETLKEKIKKVLKIKIP